MHENQTITCEAFMEFAALFQEKDVPMKGNACVQKRIPQKIQKHFTPSCIAAWFIGDGGKQCYSEKWGGKGLQLHTQGFQKEDVK